MAGSHQETSLGMITIPHQIGFLTPAMLIAALKISDGARV